MLIDVNKIRLRNLHKRPGYIERLEQEIVSLSYALDKAYGERDEARRYARLYKRFAKIYQEREQKTRSQLVWLISHVFRSWNPDIDDEPNHYQIHKVYVAEADAWLKKTSSWHDHHVYRTPDYIVDAVEKLRGAIGGRHAKY